MLASRNLASAALRSLHFGLAASLAAPLTRTSRRLNEIGP